MSLRSIFSVPMDVKKSLAVVVVLVAFAQGLGTSAANGPLAGSDEWLDGTTRWREFPDVYVEITVRTGFGEITWSAGNRWSCWADPITSARITSFTVTCIFLGMAQCSTPYVEVWANPRVTGTSGCDGDSARCTTPLSSRPLSSCSQGAHVSGLRAPYSCTVSVDPAHWGDVRLAQSLTRCLVAIL